MKRHANCILLQFKTYKTEPACQKNRQMALEIFFKCCYSNIGAEPARLHTLVHFFYQAGFIKGSVICHIHGGWVGCAWRMGIMCTRDYVYWELGQPWKISSLPPADHYEPEFGRSFHDQGVMNLWHVTARDFQISTLHHLVTWPTNAKYNRL